MTHKYYRRGQQTTRARQGPVTLLPKNERYYVATRGVASTAGTTLSSGRPSGVVTQKDGGVRKARRTGRFRRRAPRNFPVGSKTSRKRLVNTTWRGRCYVLGRRGSWHAKNRFYTRTNRRRGATFRQAVGLTLGWRVADVVTRENAEHESSKAQDPLVRLPIVTKPYKVTNQEEYNRARSGLSRSSLLDVAFQSLDVEGYLNYPNMQLRRVYLVNGDPVSHQDWLYALDPYYIPIGEDWHPRRAWAARRYLQVRCSSELRWFKD